MLPGRDSARVAGNQPFPVHTAAGILPLHPCTMASGGNGQLQLKPALWPIHTGMDQAMTAPGLH